MDIEAARSELEQILQRYVMEEDAMREFWVQHDKSKHSTSGHSGPQNAASLLGSAFHNDISSKYFLRKDAEEIIGVGQDQVVIDIGFGYAAKIPITNILPNYYLFSAPPLCKFPEKQNSEILRELGYDAPTHEHIGLNIQRVDSGLGIVAAKALPVNRNRRICYIELTDSKCSLNITNNLKQNGNSIQDATTENMSLLKNHQEIGQQYHEMKARLLEIADGKDPRYSMEILKSSSLESKPIVRAIEDMFFLAAENGIGRLILGDLNHFRLYKK